MKDFLKRLLSGKQNATPEVEIPTWTEIKSLLFPPFDAALNALGLYRQGQMIWVERNSDENGIRRMFEIRALKGAGLSTEWGYSFDFVPHISGSSVKWHRTEKSALIDVSLGSGRRADEMTYLYGLDHLAGQIPAALDASMAAAQTFWTPRPALTDLPALMDSVASKRARSKTMPSINLLPQMQIAQAFILARTGNVQEAEVMLRGTLAKLSADPDVTSEMLKRLRATAP